MRHGGITNQDRYAVYRRLAQERELVVKSFPQFERMLRKVRDERRQIEKRLGRKMNYDELLAWYAELEDDRYRRRTKRRGKKSK